MRDLWHEPVSATFTVEEWTLLRLIIEVARDRLADPANVTEADRLSNMIADVLRDTIATARTHT